MKILVSGSSGLVGSVLVEYLKIEGHQAVRLVRRPCSQDQDGEISWDPEAGTIEAARLEGFDAVVHLAGHGIADKRWSSTQKAKILGSRVEGTRLLCQSLADLEQPPKVIVAASAIGCYSNRNNEILDESSALGSGFLAEVTQKWESATEPAINKGIRVVNPRLGVVLSPKGGSLGRMLPFFKLGIAGRIGNGTQYLSWISIDDVTGAILHILSHEELQGPVNTVAPNPVTNLEFTKALGKVLSRPTILPMPAFAARLLFGEMADELLLASTRVQPKRLLSSGYEFKHPDLEPALRHLLEK